MAPGDGVELAGVDPQGEALQRVKGVQVAQHELREAIAEHPLATAVDHGLLHPFVQRLRRAADLS